MPDHATTYVTLTVNLQGMSHDRAVHGSDASKHFGGKAHGRYMASTGARRLFDFLDEMSLKATVFVPGSEAEEHPDLVRDIHRRGHEIAALGWGYEDYTGDAEDEILLMRTHAVLTDIVGTPPQGWRAPTGILSVATLSLLDAIGYRYDASNQDDDFPYRLGPDGAPNMIELPQQEMLFDKELYDRRLTHEGLMTWWRDEFDGLHKEKCYAQFTVTPRADFGSARASRVEAMRQFFSRIQSLSDVSFVTCAEALDEIAAGRMFCR